MRQLTIKSRKPYRIQLKPMRILPIHWLFKRKLEDMFRPRYYTFNLQKDTKLSSIFCEEAGEVYLCMDRLGVQ
jgi:hypothetical protein